MTIQQKNVFKQLLQSWNRHQDLRDGGAPIADLAASRKILDGARLEAARNRAQLAA